MNIIEMNAGEKIPYEIAGTAVSLNGGAMTIDLAARQKDVAVYIDIFRSPSGVLQEGGGEAYAANIVVPPWIEREADSGETDDDGRPVYAMQRDPLAIDDVTLKLWAIPEQHKPKTQNGGGDSGSTQPAEEGKEE